MLKKFLLWLQGYLYVKIYGFSPERFLNLCNSKGIGIWNLHKLEDGYIFHVRVRDYLQLKPIVRKTKTMPYVKKRVGLPFFLKRIRKRKGYVIGVLLFIVLLFNLSLFIWDISIQGGSKHTPEALLKFLHTQNIYTGIKKDKIDCQEIEENIRLTYKDISWVSAEIKGTRLIIQITETNMPVPKETVEVPSHIVATRNGIVTSIITRRGTPLVKVGDVVKRGDILVSGVVEVKDDFDTVINRKSVIAEADVVCKSYYPYEDSFYLDYIDKIYTNEVKKVYSIQFFLKKFNLYKPRISYDKYDIIVDDSTVKLSNNFYLPIKYQISHYREYYEVDKTYTKDEAIGIAKDNLKVYIEKLIASGVKILENQVEFTVDNTTCRASGNLIVEEACWEYRTIEENEWRVPETDELNRDNN